MGYTDSTTLISVQYSDLSTFTGHHITKFSSNNYYTLKVELSNIVIEIQIVLKMPVYKGLLKYIIKYFTVCLNET